MLERYGKVVDVARKILIIVLVGPILIIFLAFFLQQNASLSLNSFGSFFSLNYLNVFTSLLPLTLLYPILALIVSLISEPINKRSLNFLSRKLNRDQRLIINNLLRSTAIVLLIISSILMLWYIPNSTPLVFVPLLVVFGLLFISNLMVDDYDLAIARLRKFNLHREEKNLQKSLLIMNRILDNKFSTKALLGFSQSIAAIYAFNKEEIFAQRLDQTIEALEAKNKARLSDSILNWYSSTEESLKAFKAILASPKLPLRLRITEILPHLLSELLPQIILLLIAAILSLFRLSI